MPVNWVTYTSFYRERDMLGILMDSTLQERCILLPYRGVLSFDRPFLAGRPMRTGA